MAWPSAWAATIKTETISRLHFDTVSQLLSALYGFERSFNSHRPHKALGGKTPYRLTRSGMLKPFTTG